MGYKVGIADVDIHGPNIPKMLGVEGGRLKDNENGIDPLSVNDNLKVVSLAFLLKAPISLLHGGILQSMIISVSW